MDTIALIIVREIENNNIMIDFHTHILPNMDDGSDSAETSNKMLNILEKENVKLVCLTSHFYAFNESIDDYIARRDKAFKELKYKGKLILKLGAEIRFYRGISVSEDIDKLLLEGTNILLIELPFLEPITKTMIDEIIRLKEKGYDIVLAHIERYHLNKKTLNYLRKYGIKMQMNIDAVKGFFSRRKALNLIKEGYIYYLGTDCHNLADRKPMILYYINLLKNKLDVDDLSTYINGLNCI